MKTVLGVSESLKHISHNKKKKVKKDLFSKLFSDIYKNLKTDLNQIYKKVESSIQNKSEKTDIHRKQVLYKKLDLNYTPHFELSVSHHQKLPDESGVHPSRPNNNNLHTYHSKGENSFSQLIFYRRHAFKRLKDKSVLNVRHKNKEIIQKYFQKESYSKENILAEGKKSITRMNLQAKNLDKVSKNKKEDISKVENKTDVTYIKPDEKNFNISFRKDFKVVSSPRLNTGLFVLSGDNSYSTGMISQLRVRSPIGNNYNLKQNFKNKPSQDFSATFEANQKEKIDREIKAKNLIDRKDIFSKIITEKTKKKIEKDHKKEINTEVSSYKEIKTTKNEKEENTNQEIVFNIKDSLQEKNIKKINEYEKLEIKSPEKNDKGTLENSYNSSDDFSDTYSETDTKENTHFQTNTEKDFKETKKVFTLSINFNDTSLTAKLRNNTLSLSILLNNATFTNIFSLKTEIKNILKETGFENYNLKIQLKGKKIYYSNNREERREINVKA